MADVKIAGETFHVLVEGPERAPVIMLSNSLGTNLHLWDGQVAALTKHFKVVRYDSRGHGKSPVSGGAFSIAGLGRDADLGCELPPEIIRPFRVDARNRIHSALRRGGRSTPLPRCGLAAHLARDQRLGLANAEPHVRDVARTGFDLGA